MKMLKKSVVSRASVATFAMVALIAAQVAVLNHDLAPGSHTPDSVCEFCIAGSGLAGANVSEVRIAFSVSVSLRIPDPVHRVHSNVPPRYHFARAPPTVS